MTTAYWEIDRRRAATRYLHAAPLTFDRDES
jgi:hypothetical protein